MDSQRAAGRQVEHEAERRTDERARLRVRRAVGRHARRSRPPPAAFPAVRRARSMDRWMPIGPRHRQRCRVRRVGACGRGVCLG